jgi:hypothetical protein
METTNGVGDVRGFQASQMEWMFSGLSMPHNGCLGDNRTAPPPTKKTPVALGSPAGVFFSRFLVDEGRVGL